MFSEEAWGAEEDWDALGLNGVAVDLAAAVATVTFDLSMYVSVWSKSRATSVSSSPSTASSKNSRDSPG